jgi:hypothetical protein
VSGKLFLDPCRRAVRRGYTDEKVYWDGEAGVQSSNHRQSQRPLSAEHLRHTRAAADEGFEVFAGKALLLHLELDERNGIGSFHGEVPRLIGVDECGEHLEFIALLAARTRSNELPNARDRVLVLFVSSNSRCVPIQRIKTTLWS